ncbi:MAG: DUF4364 family protein [Oscillospiraceae bacterium]
MSNNAFVAGVKPGGLTNDYEVKIIICYIMSVIQSPLSREDINKILSTDGLVNYFECSQSISDLLLLHNIKRIEGNEFILLDLGKETAKVFERSIPIAVKERAIKNAQEYIKYKKMEKENIVTIEKVQDGYNITLNVNDKQSSLMKITLFSPDLKYCDIIKNQFYNDPVQTYKAIIALLTGDTNTVYSVLAEKILNTNKDI